MPNFSSLFPELGFGTTNGNIENWAEVGNTTLIPSTKLEAINIGNIFTYSTATTTESAALTEFYAVATNRYHQGDTAIVTYNTGGTSGTVTLIYTGTNQSTAGISAAGDWTTVSSAASGVTSITGGNGINASASTGAVTVRNDLKVSLDDGTSVPASGTYISRINFTGDGVSVAADSTNADVVDINIDPEVSYTINTTPAANTNITLVKNTVQVLPAATSTRTFTLPAVGSGATQVAAGDWIKIVNLTGRTDTIINRNGALIQTNSTNLVLDDATASFELIYVDATYGWVIVGAN